MIKSNNFIGVEFTPEQFKWLAQNSREIRKETAKEIFSLLLSDEYICYFDVAVVKEIAEKYGVKI